MQRSSWRAMNYRLSPACPCWSTGRPHPEPDLMQTDRAVLPARHPAREIARSIAGQICLHASMAGARMATALLALSQGYSKMAVGALVAQFALTQVFLSLPAGRFADRHGLKRPVAYSVIAASLGLCLAAIWPVYPVLCVCALLCGGATGAASIALQRHVGRLASTPAQLRT